MIDPQLPGQWKTWQCSFIAANGVLAKILADVTPAQVLAAINGENALPGEATVRQRVLTGGQRVIDGSIASTDGAAKSLLQYIGKQMSLFANMGAVSITGTNAINRTAGSFLADGWKVGDAVMPFGNAVAANEGAIGTVTAVTALALTCNGAPFTNSAAEAAGFRLFRVSQWTRRAVPANSGNADATPPVQLLGGSQDPSAFPAPDTGISLDADSALIVAMVAAVAALPARVDVRAYAALY